EPGSRREEGAMKLPAIRGVFGGRILANYPIDPGVVACPLPGACARFDSALLTREIDHEWHSREDLCCPALAAD
ncbi:MAG: hypothetical protein ACE5GW_01105, partial [Planctomycetota bacterium]